MDKKYSRELNVYEKQNKGESLSPSEKRWKKRYNANRVLSECVIDGVKITRYRPNWETNEC